MSSKILTAGLLYFIIGYFVSKYQLLYACVHPPHSTGKVWPIIFRRIILGYFFSNHHGWHISITRCNHMCYFLGTIAVLTLYFWWSFHKQYIPLSTFIALRAIESNENINPTDLEQIIENNNNKTLDERRELNTKYEYPNLVNDLDGPMIALDGEDVLIVNRDGTTVRKPPQYFSSEWDY